MELTDFIRQALREDQGSGDHTSLACIPENAIGSAKLLVKQQGVIAGIDLAKAIFHEIDNSLELKVNLTDGDEVMPGGIAFTVHGGIRSVLLAERLVLNCMQRMSGIATLTREYVKLLDGTQTRVLDTRKTSPLLRNIEKWAVRIGGGHNHRMGLYDMILIKDNHIDYAGGIRQAIRNVAAYKSDTNLRVPVEIETRNLTEVKEVLEEGNVNRIMLDNFDPQTLRLAVELIAGKYETEASGGITLATARDYAKTGVDFISVGELTHSPKCLDLSLKAVNE